MIYYYGCQAKAESAITKRGVAQSGRALGSGPRGRWFESSHSEIEKGAKRPFLFRRWFRENLPRVFPERGKLASARAQRGGLGSESSHSACARRTRSGRGVSIAGARKAHAERERGFNRKGRKAHAEREQAFNRRGERRTRSGWQHQSQRGAQRPLPIPDRTPARAARRAKNHLPSMRMNSGRTASNLTPYQWVGSSCVTSIVRTV